MEPTNGVPNAKNKKRPLDDLADGLDTTGTVKPETIDTWMSTDHSDGSITVTRIPSKKNISIELSVSVGTIIRINTRVASAVGTLIETIDALVDFSSKESTQPPLRALSRLTDWVPFQGVRKCQRKLLADEQAEIAQFRSEGRLALARWRSAWAWAHWMRYLVSSPFAALLTMVKGKVGI